jgi:hypothetical protein
MQPTLPALRTTLRSTAAAYGYALSIATTMGLLTSVHGAPNAGRLFLFVAGGLLGFALLEVLLLVLPAPEGSPDDAFPFAGVLNVFSVGAALGAAIGVANAIGGAIAWGVTPLAATAVYLAVVSLQVAAVARLRG